MAREKSYWIFQEERILKIVHQRERKLRDWFGFLSTCLQVGKGIPITQDLVQREDKEISQNHKSKSLDD